MDPALIRTKSDAATVTFRPAVQVVYPGPLTTDMRQLEGVRQATRAAAEQLEVDPGSLYLAAVAIETDTEQIVYTFGVR